jgi:hypothetical protein
MMRPRLALLSVLVAALLGGCASYAGRGLQDGVSTTGDVQALMGPPTLRWPEADGGEQLAYVRGPAGFHTIMVRIDRNGILVSRENALAPKQFAKLRAGMTKDEVLRLLGPPDPLRTVYFAARDELVWDWRWCDDYAEPARFYVLFDGTSGTLRTSMSQPESLAYGLLSRDYCNRTLYGLPAD